VPVNVPIRRAGPRTTTRKHARSCVCPRSISNWDKPNGDGLYAAVWTAFATRRSGVRASCRTPTFARISCEGCPPEPLAAKADRSEQASVGKPTSTERQLRLPLFLVYGVRDVPVLHARIGRACVFAIIAFPVAVAAQEPRAYVGGTIDLATQTESDTAPLGGTIVGGRVSDWSPSILARFDRIRTSLRRLLLLAIQLPSNTVVHR